MKAQKELYCRVVFLLAFIKDTYFYIINVHFYFLANNIKLKMIWSSKNLPDHLT